MYKFDDDHDHDHGDVDDEGKEEGSRIMPANI